ETGRPAEFSPSGFHPVTGIAYRQEDSGVRLLNRVDLATACGQPHTRSGNEKFEFFGAPSPGGRSVREITSREETERPPENRLGRSQHAPACPRNRKPAGDLARQIQPLPSRSGRLLDYESSGSPSPSRSYRRPETESLPVTELTGFNLCNAPGAGRTLVGNGETGRAQSQRIRKSQLEYGSCSCPAPAENGVSHR